MEQIRSDIPIDYITVKVTQSRIDKGLLAIPVSLIDLFPQKKGSVLIRDEEDKIESKTYTPYTSSSRECRIGGLKEFYKKYALEHNDELVIQRVDDNVFKLIPEKEFKTKVTDSFSGFESSNDETESERYLKQITELSNLDRNTVLCNEFIKLSKMAVLPRGIKNSVRSANRDAVSLSIRKILLSIYKGKCQVSGFSFLMKNGNPYFEIHHINPSSGNHLKNLLVVSPNVHAQFTYANLEQSFDSDGWLRSVKFNGEYFSVFQIIDTLQKDFRKVIHFF